MNDTDSKLQEDVFQFLVLHPQVDAFEAAQVLYERQAAALDQAIEAFRNTREYIGADLMPAEPGWSWYDAVQVIREAQGMSPLTEEDFAVPEPTEPDGEGADPAI